MNNSLDIVKQIAIKLKFENYDIHQQLAINKLGYEKDYVWNSNFVNK